MNLSELNEWLETDEGRQWLEDQKKPLLEKRTELLANVKSLNERLREATQRADDAEGTLKTEREAFRSTLVNNTFDQFIEERVATSFREGVKSLLSGRLTIDIEANGPQRTPVVTDGINSLPLKDGETELPQRVTLSDYLDRWQETEEASGYLRAPANVGGGVGPATPEASPVTDFERRVIEHMGV